MASSQPLRSRTYNQVVLYRFFSFINSWFALVILWMYVAAFFMGFGLLFIWPQITLMLLFVGLAGLGLVAISSSTLHGIERALARQALRSGVCPCCGGRIPLVEESADANAAVRHACSTCAAEFTHAGERVEHDPRQLRDQLA